MGEYPQVICRCGATEQVCPRCVALHTYPFWCPTCHVGCPNHGEPAFIVLRPNLSNGSRFGQNASIHNRRLYLYKRKRGLCISCGIVTETLATRGVYCERHHVEQLERSRRLARRRRQIARGEAPD